MTLAQGGHTPLLAPTATTHRATADLQWGCSALGRSPLSHPVRFSPSAVERRPLLAPAGIIGTQPSCKAPRPQGTRPKAPKARAGHTLKGPPRSAQPAPIDDTPLAPSLLILCMGARDCCSMLPGAKRETGGTAVTSQIPTLIWAWTTTPCATGLPRQRVQHEQAAA